MLKFSFKSIIALSCFVLLCKQINQKCQQGKCPANSVCNQNGFCECEEGWALDCQLPAKTINDINQIFQISQKPSYFTVVPSSQDSIFVYRFYLCVMDQVSKVDFDLSLFADEGVQSQLNNQNLIGNLTLESQTQCWPLFSPYMNFGIQPNGQIQQMILRITIMNWKNAIPKNNQDTNTENQQKSLKISLNVNQLFFIKIRTLWIIVICFISFIALSLIIGIAYCIFALRRGNQRFLVDNNISYFDNLIPKIKIKNGDEIIGHSCPVCLLDFQIGQQVRKTLCNHIFHFQCLDEWCKKNITCPVCRCNLSKKQLEQRKKSYEKQISLKSRSSTLQINDNEILDEELTDRKQYIRQRLIINS